MCREARGNGQIQVAISHLPNCLASAKWERKNSDQFSFDRRLKAGINIVKFRVDYDKASTIGHHQKICQPAAL
jgi:hypothetical protein